MVVVGLACATTSAAAEVLFSTKSPWNISIPKAAKAGLANVTADLAVGIDTWDPNGAWTVPFYSARTGDPSVRLLYNAKAWSAVFTGAWRRSGNTPAVEAAILASSSVAFPYPGNVFSSTSATSWTMPVSYNKLPVNASVAATFQVPSAGLTPASGADGHMAVRQPSGGVLETYGTIVLSDRTIVALSYAVTDPTGLGDGWQRGQTASMLPSYAGAIIDEEISAGIKHAMAITVPAKLLYPQAAYPAYAFDRDALTSQPPYSGRLPMGTRLALPAGLPMGGLRLSTGAGRAIATAAQTYGFIIVDRGGDGITIRVRPNTKALEPSLHRYDWPLSEDLKTIFAHLRVVTF